MADSNSFKVCGHCKEAKPLSDFYVATTGKRAGLPYSTCKQCESSRHSTRKKKKRNPDPNVSEKTCLRCYVTKPISEFHLCSTRKDGYHTQCKACTKERHVTRVNKLKSIPITITEKHCPRCDKTKPVNEFYRNNANLDKVGQFCRTCQKAKTMEYYFRDPVTKRRKAREYGLFRTFGITQETYNKILESQGGVCKICGATDPGNGKHRKKPLKHFAVDHCHVTGTIRGLLCMRCNVTLARIGDTLESAMKFIEYLHPGNWTSIVATGCYVEPRAKKRPLPDTAAAQDETTTQPDDPRSADVDDDTIPACSQISSDHRLVFAGTRYPPSP